MSPKVWIGKEERVDARNLDSVQSLGCFGQKAWLGCRPFQLSDSF